MNVYKFLFWVGIGLWVIPQLEKQVISRIDRKRFSP